MFKLSGVSVWAEDMPLNKVNDGAQGVGNVRTSNRSTGQQTMIQNTCSDLFVS